MRLKERLEHAGFNVLHEGQIAFDDGTGRERYDLYVDEHVVVELKCSGMLTSLHQNQIHRYMQGLHCKYGVLINFPNRWRQTVDAEKWIYTSMAAPPGRWDMLVDQI